jgi:hypothetical protein
MSEESPAQFPLFENKWDNIYLFARMLINNDQYGRIGNDIRLLLKLASALREAAKNNEHANDEKILALQKMTFQTILTDRFKNAKTRRDRIANLCSDLDKEITNRQEMNAFIFTCESIMLPINQALQKIPSNDKKYTLEIARSFLDLQGEKGLATILRF